jgi:hypothetical protein
MQRCNCLRDFHVALVEKFIDRGETQTLPNFDHSVCQVY